MSWRAAGVKVAICTNMLADIQMEKLEYLGIADQGGLPCYE